jgi:hypothetical protein
MATKKTSRAIRSTTPPPQTPPASKAPIAGRAQPHALSTAPHDDPHAVWQTAHDALQTAFEAGNHLLDQLHDPDQRALLNSILGILSDELTALNREEMEDRTISLAAANQQLGAGIARLKVLQGQLAQIAATISEAAKVASAINNVVSGLEFFLGTFPAL